MKVTKGDTVRGNKKVIAFYSGFELVFRDLDSDKNCSLNGKSVYKGINSFEGYLKSVKDRENFIAFYEGDTINIQL